MLFPKAHKIGLGLRPAHFDHLEKKAPTVVGCLEALTEHYLELRGRPRTLLAKLRQDHPLAFHGNSLQLANAEGLNETYLQQLVQLADEMEPFIISDHLSYSGHANQSLHKHLPLPYSFECLDILCSNIDRAQNALQRPLAVENVTHYLLSDHSQMSEIEFMNTLCKKTGCQLLLDLNSVFNNSVNHDFDPVAYVQGLDMNCVAQVHLSGGEESDGIMIDSRSRAVGSELWTLYVQVLPLIRHLPLVIERDRNIPEFRDLEKEVLMALHFMEMTDEAQPNAELA